MKSSLRGSRIFSARGNSENVITRSIGLWHRSCYKAQEIIIDSLQITITRALWKGLDEIERAEEEEITGKTASSRYSALRNVSKRKRGANPFVEESFQFQWTFLLAHTTRTDASHTGWSSIVCANSFWARARAILPAPLLSWRSRVRRMRLSH